MEIAGTQIQIGVFVGAMTGATLAIAIQLISGWVRNYRSYRFLFLLLQEEVADIADQVNKRKAHLDFTIPLYPSLSTKAWDTLIQAQQRRFMRKPQREALSSLYKAVSRANKYLELIPATLQISQLANEEDVRTVYRDEVSRLLKHPLTSVINALPEAQQAVGLAVTELTEATTPAIAGER